MQVDPILVLRVAIGIAEDQRDRRPGIGRLEKQNDSIGIDGGKRVATRSRHVHAQVRDFRRSVLGKELQTIESGIDQTSVRMEDSQFDSARSQVAFDLEPQFNKVVVLGNIDSIVGIVGLNAPTRRT